MKTKPTLGILLGDACGIGPELIAKLCDLDKLYKYCHPIIIGDIRVLEKAKILINGKFTIQAIQQVMEANWDAGVYPVLDQQDVDPNLLTMGLANAIAGRGSVNMLQKALLLCEMGEIDGFAYAPINVLAIKMAGIDFKSDNNLFTEFFNMDHTSGEINVLDGLWIARVTSHIPLKEVSEHITIENIYQAVKRVHQVIKRIEEVDPLIGVAAINPHAGENGKCGQEELEIILPAVNRANENGINAVGVFPADTLFLKAFNGDFNAVVTMYHDQGHIALKLKGIQYGITFHTNLPYAITTTLHGTGYDIAGKGVAAIDAMENAIKLTAKVALKPNN